MPFFPLFRSFGSRPCCSSTSSKCWLNPCMISSVSCFSRFRRLRYPAMNEVSPSFSRRFCPFSRYTSLKMFFPNDLISPDTFQRLLSLMRFSIYSSNQWSTGERRSSFSIMESTASLSTSPLFSSIFRLAPNSSSRARLRITDWKKESIVSMRKRL